MLKITTYAELREIAEAFTLNHHHLLVLVGNGGVGKSETMRNTMAEVFGAETEGRWGFISVKTAPMALYQKLHDFRLVPMVIDDVDQLLAERQNIALLKAACDTRPVKRIAWHSMTRTLAANNLPTEFESISNVCVILNDLAETHKNMQALLNRGLVVEFKPDAMEVHREVARGGWFDDQEVFEFIGEHLEYIQTPSLRSYTKWRDTKRSGLNWKKLYKAELLDTLGDEQIAMVEAHRQKHKTEGSRREAWQRETGKSRAEYFRALQTYRTNAAKVDKKELAMLKLRRLEPGAVFTKELARRRELEMERDMVAMGAQMADDHEEDSDDQ